MNTVARVAVFMMVLNAVHPSAIPIWELLNYDEKVDSLLKLLSHLVNRFCKTSPQVPDCKRTLLQYGLANLLNFDEDTLNLLDPYQRDSRNILWNAAIRSVLKLPSTTQSPQDYQRVDRYSYYPFY